MRDPQTHYQMYGTRVTYRDRTTEDYGWTTSMNTALGELYGMKGKMEHPDCPVTKVEMIRGVFLEEV